MKPAWLLPVLILLASSLFGQDFQGTILGRITDSSRAVAPDGQVTLVNIGTAASSGAKSNAQGNDRPPFPLSGDYCVLIEHAGFQKFERRNAPVSMGAESVTVAAAPSARLIF